MNNQNQVRQLQPCPHGIIASRLSYLVPEIPLWKGSTRRNQLAQLIRWWVWLVTPSQTFFKLPTWFAGRFGFSAEQLRKTMRVGEPGDMPDWVLHELAERMGKEFYCKVRIETLRELARKPATEKPLLYRDVAEDMRVCALEALTADPEEDSEDSGDSGDIDTTNSN